MEDRTLDTIAAMIDTLTQTDEWNAIGSKDPAIVNAGRKFEETTARMKLTDDQAGELNAACNLCSAAHVDAAILYGMRVAFALLETINYPEALSLRYVERTEDHEGH